MTTYNGFPVIPHYKMESEKWIYVADVINDFETLPRGSKIHASKMFRLENPDLEYGYCYYPSSKGTKARRLVCRDTKKVGRKRITHTKVPTPRELDWSTAFNSLVSMLDDALAENAKLKEALALEQERSRQFEFSPNIEKLSPRARQVLSTLHNKR